MATITIIYILSLLLILNDVVVSDHKSVSFNVEIPLNCSSVVNDSTNDSVKYIPQWDKCDSSILLHYANHMDNLLSSIEIPYDIIMNDMSNDSYLSIKKVDKFYTEIISCVKEAVLNVIPSRKATCVDFIVPG